MSIIKKIAYGLLALTKKSDHKIKAAELKKDSFVNKFFAEAMAKGEMEIDPYFILNDGTEVYLSKLGSASYELYLMATQEIPRHYDEFGLMREKLLNVHAEVMKNIGQAQMMIESDGVEAFNLLKTATNLILGLGADIGFGSPVRRHIEQVMCFLHTKAMNPYAYDYDEKQELMSKVLLEWERLSFFLDRIQLWVLMGWDSPLAIDSWYSSHREIMERPEIKLQLAVLQRIGLEGLSKEKETSKEIITEYMNLSELVKIGYD